MYLVYEKNYLNYSDVDCVEKGEMKLFHSWDNAIKEMEERKRAYIEDKDNGFTFMEDEGTSTCIVFADELKQGGDRDGEFHICLAQLPVCD